MRVMDTSAQRLGCVSGTFLAVWLLRYRRRRADQELDAEHPTWTSGNHRTRGLIRLALQVAADIPDDADAVAAISAAGGDPTDLKRAAASIRADRYRYEHRVDRRAARLLQAVAEGGPLVTASSDEEALFQGVDNLEALPIEDAFAVLAEEVPALRKLEHQVITARSTPGWEDRDEDDRADEILERLNRLTGPQAPEGSPLIRSEVANGHARVYLLGKAGLLIDELPEADSAEKAALLGLLARGYGVRPDMKRVTKAISKRVADRDGFATLGVLSLLRQEPGIETRLRRGDGPSDSYRKAMTRLLASNLPRLSSPEEFVEAVVEEVRSTLLRVSRDIGEERNS